MRPQEYKCTELVTTLRPSFLPSRNLKCYTQICRKSPFWGTDQTLICLASVRLLCHVPANHTIYMLITKASCMLPLAQYRDNLCEVYNLKNYIRYLKHKELQLKNFKKEVGVAVTLNSSFWCLQNCLRTGEMPRPDSGQFLLLWLLGLPRRGHEPPTQVVAKRPEQQTLTITEEEAFLNRVTLLKEPYSSSL